MKINKSIRIGLVVGLITMNSFGAAALDPITSGTVAAGLNLMSDSVFDNIDKSVDNLFDNVDDSAAKLRGLTDGLLASARSDLEGIMDKSITELNRQERQIWNYYYNMMNDLDRRVAGYLKEGRYTMLHAGNVVNEIVPFASNKPQIFWIEAEPPFYKYDAPHRTITAYGLNLDHAKNKLTSGRIDGTRTTLSPTKLAFQFNNINVENGLLVDFELWEDRFLWDKISPTPQIALPAVEDYLGDIALIYTSEKDVVSDRIWPASGTPHRIECRNSSTKIGQKCRAKSGTRTITANAGFSILPDTIRFVKNSNTGSCEWHRFASSNESANAFNWSHNAKARKGLGRRCWGKVAVSWQEVRDQANLERNISDYKPFKRSLHGASFEYPLQDTDPIGMSFKPAGSDEPQSLSLSSLRWPIETTSNTGTGIIEVSWLK